MPDKDLESVKTAILARLYALDEEYDLLVPAQRFVRHFGTPDDERFYGFPLDDTHFVFLNDVLISGPRGTAGMVGVYGKREGMFLVLEQETFELFNSAGEAAIKYWHRKDKSRPDIVDTEPRVE